MSRTRNFGNGVFVFFAVLVCMAFGLTACQVGLGAAVDTSDPRAGIITPSVSYPSVGGPTIHIAGSCEDDTGIAEIRIVQLRNVETGEEYNDLGNAVLSENGREWSFDLIRSGTSGSTYSVNDRELKLQDGRYELTIIPVDLGGRTPRYGVTRTIEIDNTPPIFLISSPNSTNISDPAPFGQTVKVKGVPIDDHEIKSMEVKVYDTVGSRVTIAETGDLERVQSKDKDNFSIILAKKTYKPSETPDEAALDNYGVLYPTGTNGQKYYYMEVVLEDSVNMGTDLPGNKSRLVYFKTPLFDKLRDLGINIVDSVELKRGYNGTSSIFSAQQCETIRQVLDGTYDDDTSYYAKVSETSDGRLAFSVNPNNNPKYSFGGMAYSDNNPVTWRTNKAAAGGTVTLMVSASSDEEDDRILPSTIVVKLIPVDNDGNKLYGQALLSTSANGPSLELGSTPVETATYTVTLPDDLNYTYYSLEVTGQDGQGKDLEANATGYGFMLYSNKIPVTITTEDDQKYMAKSDGNTYPFNISVTDPNSLVTINTTGSVRYQVQTDNTHRAKSSYTTESWNGLAEHEATLTAGGEAGSFTSEIGVSYSVPTEGVGTIALRIWGDNGVESDKNVYVLYIDNRKPALTVNNAAELTGGLVKEDSTYYTAGEGKYTISGTWRDVDGSGARKLEYKWGNESWTPVGVEYSGASHVTESLNWSISRTVTDASGITVIIRATDQVGNTTEDATYTYSGVTFDLGDPVFTAVPEETQADFFRTTRDFTAVATDGFGLQEITAVAKQDGTTVASGSNGYSLTVTDTEAGNNKSKTATVRIAPASNADGKWEIELTAKDLNGRTSKASFGFTFDQTKPDAGIEDSLPEWQRDRSARISGTVNEAISLKNLYYLVRKSGESLINVTADTDISGMAGVQSLAYTNRKGSAIPFSITVDELTDNQSHGNMVYIQPVDEAGNKGLVKSVEVNVDQAVPELEALKYSIAGGETGNATGTIAVNSSTLTLYGTYSDTASGVGELGIEIGSTSVTAQADIRYTTDAVNATGITGAGIGWNEYNSSQSTQIKGWKATIPAGALASGTVKINGRDAAGNTASHYSVTLKKDTTAPTVSNVTIEGENVYRQNDTTYWVKKVDDQTTQIAVKGVSADDYALKDTVITIEDLAPITRTGASWTTGSTDISGLTGSSATVTVKSRDSAGNWSDPTEITLKFDETAPSRNKTVNTRDTVGWGTADNWEDLQLEIGSGHYYLESYSGSTSLRVGGRFTEEGSGIRAVYYELVSGTAAHTMTAANYQTFSSVVPAADGSFSTTITGLQEGSNNLRIIAVDNVGNVSRITDSAYKYESDFVLGLDQMSPSFGNGFTLDGSDEYVTGTEDFTIKDGTVSDDLAGVDPSTIKFWFVNKNNPAVRYEITRTAGTYGQLIYDQTDPDDKNRSADITINVTPGTWFTEANLGSSPILYGTMNDYSTPANSAGTVTILTTLKLDQTVPEIAIDNNLNTTPITDENDGGKIRKVGEDYFYELTGTWSDANGSGTDKLYYSINNGTAWVDADTLSTKNYAKSKAESAWSLSIPVTEGTSYTFAVKAKDAAGNEKEAKPSKTVTFDFSKPTITVDRDSGIYGGTRPQATITANDHYQISDITVVSATKNGAAAVQGTDYVLSAITGGGTATATRVVTIETDGVFEFTFKATDVNNRSSDTVSRTWTVDTVAPAPKADNDATYGLKVNGAAAKTWYRDTNLRFDGYVTEEISGLSKVYYLVSADDTADDADVLAGSQWNFAGSSNTGTVAYSVTPTVGDGTSYIHMIFEDAAGNQSEVKTSTVKLDQDVPTISGKFYTYNGVTAEMPSSLFVNTGKSDTLTLYGLVNETGSGIDTLTLTKSGDTFSPTITYATGLTGTSAANEFTGATWSGTKTGATAWKATFNVNGLSTGPIQASVNDVAGNGSTVQLVSLDSDATAPTLTLTNSDLQTAPYGISERSPYMTVDGGHHNYTFQGSWSDAGSGTYALYYSTNSSTIGSGTWTPVDSTSAPQSTGTTNWTLTLDLEEGTGKQIAFYAEDKVGNKSAVISKTGITVDYTDPTLTLTPATAESYYPLEASNTAIWTITASDNLGTPAITVVARKDGSVVSSGTNGYTYNASSKTITLANNANANGTWNITVTATDGAERTSVETLNTIVDRSKPTFNNDIEIHDGDVVKDYDVNSWSRNGTLTVKGTIDEAGSGLSIVYFMKGVANGVTNLKEITSEDRKSVGVLGIGSSVEYEFTVSDLAAGSTVVGIQTEDKAGNLSDIKRITLNLDKTNPSFGSTNDRYYSFASAADYKLMEGTILSNGTKDIYFVGPYSDAGSGVEELAFETVRDASSSATNCTVEYSTDTIASGATNIGSMSWKTYAQIADKTTIKSYRAKIGKDDFENGDSIVAKPLDRAGNGSTQPIFTIAIDSTAPVITLNTPKTKRLLPTADAESVNTVNGTITFAGTTDETSMDNLKLYWGTAQNACNTLFETKLAAQSYNWSFDVPLSTVDSGTVKFIDESNYAGSTRDIFLKLVATDKAGNSTDYVYQYTVDPDKDRPIITFPQLDLSGLTESSSVSLTTDRTLTGSVTDDDGISKLEYQIGSGEWTELTVTNGNFSYTFTDETNYAMKFRVTDAAGTEFETKLSPAAQYLAPKFVDKNTNSSTCSVLNLLMDVTAPVVSGKFYTYSGVTDAMPGNLFVNTSESKTLTLYGLVTETGSGIDTLSLTKAGDSFSPTISYASGLTVSSAANDFTGATWGSTKTGATAWRATFNVSGLSNGAIQATVSDVAGNSGSAQIVTLYSDATVPTLTLSNSDLETAPYSITERSPYMNVDGEHHNYTFQGTWSDTGSGTYKLYYSTTTSTFNASTWEEVPTSSAPQATGTTNWTLTLDLEEGNNKQINFCAVDKVGNQSAIISKTGITVDYTDPTLTLTPAAAETYYGVETTNTAVWEVSATDALGAPTVTVVAKKDGSEVSSGTNGFTYSANTITLATTSTANGVWNITVTATDGAGRTTVKTLNTTVDRSKPVVTDTLEIHDGENVKEYSTTSWSKNGTLTLAGKINEAGSGLKALYYKKNIDLDATNIRGNQDSSISLAGSGAEVDYEVTVAGLISGSTPVGIQVEDLAGNLSDVKVFTINVDKRAPTFNYHYYSYDEDANYTETGGTVLSNGENDLYLVGSYSDADSGIDQLKFEINETELTSSECVLEYSTDIIASAATNIGSMAWESYNQSNAGNYKSYRAKIVKNKFSSAGGVVDAKPIDRAGNGSTQTIFTIAIDNTAPVLTLNTPKTQRLAPTADAEAVNTVNGTVAFAGTTEETAMNRLELYWGAAQDACNTLIDTKAASQSYNWTFEVPLSTVQDGTTVKFIDGSNYTGSVKVFYLKLRAVDKAGNTADYIYKYNVDPDGDRPIITFRQLDLTELTESSATSNVWLTGTKDLTGVVTDDDGIDTLECKIGNGPWTVLPVTNGTFSCSFTEEAKYSLQFRVKDKAGPTGTTFTTDIGGNQFLAPKFMDKNAFESDYSVLNLAVDTKQPVIHTIEFIANNGSDEPANTDFTAKRFGGNWTKFKIRFTATDQNGINDSEAKVNFNGTTYTTSLEDGYYTTEYIYLNTLSSGNYNVAITVKDNAGYMNEDSRSFVVDNDAPTVRIQQPSSLVSMEAQAVGSLSESNGIEHVYYLVTKQGVDRTDIVGEVTGNKNAANLWKEYVLPDKNPDPDVYEADHGISGFEIGFDDTTGDNHTEYLKWYLVGEGLPVGQSDQGHEGVGITTTDKINGTNGATRYTEITAVDLHIKAVDSYGNIGYATKTLTVDPQGDKPTVTITYPLPGSKLGGSIPIMGTAIDNVKADNVMVMIDMDGDINDDNDWDRDDITALQTIKNNKPDAAWIEWYKFDATSTPHWSSVSYSTIEGLPDDTDWTKYGIKVPVSNASWNFTVNQFNELNPPSGTKNYSIWVYATDEDGNTSQIDLANQNKTPKVTFTIDKDTPQISNEYLVQYDGVNIKAKHAYSKDMSIRGLWWYEADITDDTGIAQVIRKQKRGDEIIASETVNGAGSYANGDLVLTSITNGYHIKMKVGSDESDHIEYQEWELEYQEVKDNSPSSGKREVPLTVDNKAPVIVTTGDYYNIGQPVTINGNDYRKVTNENGFFTFGTQAKEDPTSTGVAQTGVKMIAFYFTRDIGTTHKLFDIMHTPGNAEEPNAIDSYNTALELGEDGLFWKEETGTPSGNTFTLSTSNPHVHPGGLIKINGVIYTIDNVTDKTVVVKVDTTVPEPFAGVNKAKFAMASVVDNTQAETANEASAKHNGYYEDVKFDDGDHMVESLRKQSSTWTWEANINSKNIGDGKAVLHYVVFDAAGNPAPNTVDVFVANNQPRIAGVSIGTDTNGNGSVDDSEMISEGYSGIYAKGKQGNKNVTEAWFPSDKSSSVLKILGNTKIKPEIVGGNGQLDYSYKVYESNGNGSWNTVLASGGGTGIGTGNGDDRNPDAEPDAQILEVNLTMAELLGMGNKMGSDFALTIADQTPGGALTATLNIIVDSLLQDNNPPKSRIIPFYWVSGTKNSLFMESKDYGHIELPIDLPNTFTAGGTGVNDRDPKLSGIVKIEGVAQDDVLLKQLKVNVGGTEYTIGTYNGDWTYTNGWDGSAIPTNSWKSLVTNATYREAYDMGFIPQEDFDALDEVLKDTPIPYITAKYGHIVHWTLYIDSSSIGNGTDKAIRASATDRGMAAAGGGGSVSYTPNSWTEANNAGVTANVSDNGTPTGYQRVDVVPYISKVYTSLAKNKVNNWSVYNRTALGHYPVQSVVSNIATTGNYKIDLKTKTSETVTLYGFNINDSSVRIQSGTNNFTGSATGNLKIDYSTRGQLSFNVAQLASGPLNLTVNGFEVMNNINNNDAKGSATEEGTAYANWYNRQGNGDTNNILTDDIWFDVWEFNDRASTPINGLMTGINMEINQKTKMLNYAFANGGLYYSMGGNTGKTTAYDSTNSYSSIYWAGDWDTFAGPSVGFHVDDLGWTYSLDSGGDTNSSGSVDKWAFYTSRWNRGSLGTEGTLGGGNSLRLEEIGLKTGSGTYDYSLMKYRFLSAEFASTVKNNNTNLYLVYYDALTNQIRFRAGTFNGTTKQSVGGFQDEYTNGASSYYSTNNCQVIANGEAEPFPKANGTTTVPLISGRGAGQYVDVAVVNNGNNDVACVVWFDQGENALKYSYITNPIGQWNTLKGDATAKNWSTPITLFEGGEYCHIEADKNGHLHVAAYAGNGDVKYAYLDTYATTGQNIKTCTVDSSGVVGEHLTLDVAVSANGNSIPYIGYYTAALKMPKYAYLVESSAFVQAPDGVDENELFTGKWEVTVVPSPSRLTTNREDKVNVGVWKNAGVLTDSKVGGSVINSQKYNKINGYSSENWSKTFGNGTSNGVLGYQISTSTGSCLETAQMR